MRLTGFNRINPNSSIPTPENPLPVVTTTNWFQSYQSKQINPDFVDFGEVYCSRRVSIVSIKTDQSRLQIWCLDDYGDWCVSIVSIKTDQSRHGAGSVIYGANYGKFQSYQSRQINPDSNSNKGVNMEFRGVSIVSIQTDQSRR